MSYGIGKTAEYSAVLYILNVSFDDSTERWNVFPLATLSCRAECVTMTLQFSWEKFTQVFFMRNYVICNFISYSILNSPKAVDSANLRDICDYKNEPNIRSAVTHELWDRKASIHLLFGRRGLWIGFRKKYIFIDSFSFWNSLSETISWSWRGAPIESCETSMARRQTQKLSDRSELFVGCFRHLITRFKNIRKKIALQV